MLSLTFWSRIDWEFPSVRKMFSYMKYSPNENPTKMRPRVATLMIFSKPNCRYSGEGEFCLFGNSIHDTFKFCNDRAILGRSFDAIKLDIIYHDI